MIEFVSIASHAAATYLHALLAIRFYESRRESLAMVTFWSLMLLFAVLHVIYGLRVVAETYGWPGVEQVTSLVSGCLLLLTPALLAPTLFGDLTRLPEQPNVLALKLRTLASNPRAMMVGGFAISAALAIYLIVRTGLGTDGDSLVALQYAVATLAVWLVMLAAGLRYDESKTNDLVRPAGMLFAVLMVFHVLTAYVFDLGRYWSLIPLVSTVSFSLMLSWVRFRLQFIDVILRQFVVFVLVLTAVPVGFALVDSASAHPPAGVMLMAFAYCIGVAVVVRTAVALFKRVWVPDSGVLSAIHERLPGELADCTDADEAVARAERLLAGIFHAPVAINRPLADAATVIELTSPRPLTVSLGHIRGWMPWFSDAVQWARTAGLYVQGHLQVLAALEQLHRQALEARALSDLAARAELAAMRARIRPHFLFNTLNSIHSFVRDDPVAAERTIELLADLMRGALQGDDSDVCELSRELDLSRTYLEIEQMRFGERLTFDIDCPAELSAVAVPAFTVQPLVENAVKYSVDGHPDPARIRVRATADGPDLVVSVCDNGVGLAPDEHHNGLGMALDNVRARLARLYDGNANVELTQRATGGVEATLRVPRAGP